MNNDNIDFNKLTDSLNNSIEIDTKTFDPSIFIINNCNYKPINNLDKLTIFIDFSIADGVELAPTNNTRLIAIMYDDKNNIIDTHYSNICNLTKRNIHVLDIYNKNIVLNIKQTKILISTEYKKMITINKIIKEANDKIEILDNPINKCNIEIKNAGFMMQDNELNFYIEVNSLNSKKLSDDVSICFNIYDKNNNIILIEKGYLYEDSFKGYDTLTFRILDDEIINKIDHCKIYITD